MALLVLVFGYGVSNPRVRTRYRKDLIFDRVTRHLSATPVFRTPVNPVTTRAERAALVHNEGLVGLSRHVHVCYSVGGNADSMQIKPRASMSFTARCSYH